MICYEERDLNLHRIGFADYRAYLTSDLWRGIRAGVLEREKKCQVCWNERPIDIHHTRYDIDTLKGRCPENLMAVCKTCHTLLEFDNNGKKQTIEQANKTLGIIRGWKTTTLEIEKSASFHIKKAKKQLKNRGFQRCSECNHVKCYNGKTVCKSCAKRIRQHKPIIYRYVKCVQCKKNWRYKDKPMCRPCTRLYGGFIVEPEIDFQI